MYRAHFDDDDVTIPISRSMQTKFVSSQKPLARIRLSCRGVFECILLVVFMFLSSFWLLSFTFHRNHPALAVFVVGMELLFPLVLVYRGWRINGGQFSLRIASAYIDSDGWNINGGRLPGLPDLPDLNRLPGLLPRALFPRLRLADYDLEPLGYFMLAFILFSSWFCAVVCSSMNYTNNGMANIDLKSLAVIEGLDPTAQSGQQYLDAGTIVFKNGTRVSEAMSVGFKNDNVYCVAPIVRGHGKPAYYDFWAVGVNCCNPLGGQFWCGGVVRDVDAHAGTRLMNDDERPFYKMAVQQAEAEYKIKSPHPLFFTWSKSGDDPLKMNPMYRHALGYLVWGVLAYFLVIGAGVMGMCMWSFNLQVP